MSTKNRAMKNGRSALVTVSSGNLAMALPTNSTEPTGGVISPMPRFTIMIMPKCTGWMPRPWTTGSRIGVRIRISGAMSINVPSISIMMLMHSRITYLLSEIDVKNAVT
jgi:hypothetical protein